MEVTPWLVILASIQGFFICGCAVYSIRIQNSVRAPNHIAVLALVGFLLLLMSRVLFLLLPIEDMKEAEGILISRALCLTVGWGMVFWSLRLIAKRLSSFLSNGGIQELRDLCTRIFQEDR